MAKKQLKTKKMAPRPGGSEEAAKIELQKNAKLTVEPQIKALLAKGRKKGFITYEELNKDLQEGMPLEPIECETKLKEKGTDNRGNS